MGKSNERVEAIQRELAELGNPADAAFAQRYFKTGPGQYGEGDRFRGIRTPAMRALARRHAALAPEDVETLLHSPWHEDRTLALLILVRQYARGDEAARDRVYAIYLGNTRCINNWDLVDISAEYIVGAHLWERERSVLTRLAQSTSLWERRIAVLATFHFIRKGHFDDTFRVAEILLADREDLIHKAVGWMLREIGKRNPEAEETFLAAHYRTMPRTMLRYAIERFPEDRRKAYLKGEI